MPKMKSRRGAMKRFKLTASGKVKRNKAFRSHMLTKKTRKRKRDLRHSGLIHESDAKRVNKMILA